MVRASAATAEDGQVVDFGGESVALQRLLPDRVEHLVVQVHDRAAIMTNKVMVPVLIEQLVFPHAAAEVSLRDDPQIAKELESAVDGGAIDRRRIPLDAADDLVGGEMLAGFSERGQDQESLRCCPLPDRPQTGGKLSVPGF